MNRLVLKCTCMQFAQAALTAAKQDYQCLREALSRETTDRARQNKARYDELADKLDPVMRAAVSAKCGKFVNRGAVVVGTVCDALLDSDELVVAKLVSHNTDDGTCKVLAHRETLEPKYFSQGYTEPRTIARSQLYTPDEGLGPVLQELQPESGKPPAATSSNFPKLSFGVQAARWSSELSLGSAATSSQTLVGPSGAGKTVLRTHSTAVSDDSAKEEGTVRPDVVKSLMALMDIARLTKPFFDEAVCTMMQDGKDSGKLDDALKGSYSIRPVPLKSAARASVKMCTRHDGDPQQLLDLCRGMIVCDSLDVVMCVLECLEASEALDVVQIQDRLGAFADTTASGGYRDLVVHVRCQPVQHICELNITVRSLQNIKDAHNLTGEDTHDRFVHAAGTLANLSASSAGGFSDVIAAKVSCGRTRHIQVLAHTINTALFCATLRSKFCHLVSLQLHHCKGLEGLDLGSDILTEHVLGIMRLSIQAIVVDKCGVVGGFPLKLAECHRLSKLELRCDGLNGVVPKDFWKLPALVHVSLHGNNFTGVVPEEFWHKCVRYIDVSSTTSSTAATGSFHKHLHTTPPASTERAAHERCTAAIGQDLEKERGGGGGGGGGNAFEGEFPADSACTTLEHVALSGNRFSGAIPLWLGSNQYLRDLLLRVTEKSPDCNPLLDTKSSAAKQVKRQLRSNQTNGGNGANAVF